MAAVGIMVTGCASKAVAPDSNKGPDLTSAIQMAAHIKARNSEVLKVETYHPDTPVDSGRLLHAVALFDRRASCTTLGPACGASIETFSSLTAAEAATRAAQTTHGGFAKETGLAVMIVDPALGQHAAKAYFAAWKSYYVS